MGTSFTADEIRSAIVKFRALLDRPAPEEELRRFLATHVYFWNGLLRLDGLSPLYTKVSLGREYEMDFVFFDTGSSGAEWHLVEIERPDVRLFTAKGDPTAHLTHAITQVRRWQLWIEQNRSYADRLLPGVYRPMGHVFIGRREELIASSDARKSLHALNVANRHDVEVHTLDHFVSMAESSLTFLGTTLPTEALGDRALRRGLPRDALRFIQSAFGRQREFLRDRDDAVLSEEDMALMRTSQTLRDEIHDQVYGDIFPAESPETDG